MSTNTFRMSQDLSGKIAGELLTAKYKEANAILDELSEYLTQIAEKKVPVAVMELFKKHSEYVDTTQQVFIDGKGFNRAYFDLKRQVPTKGGRISLSLTDIENTKAKKLHNTWLSKSETTKRLRQEIKTALLNLKTFAQIEKAFPEALPYLPKSNSGALVVDLTKLRKEIKQATA